MRPRKDYPTSVLAIVLILIVGHAGPAHATWPHSTGVNVPVCQAAVDQVTPTSIPDGAGGAIITWYDNRSGNYDIYAQHVLASGAVDPVWPANGRALCAAAGDQYEPKLITDGAGGAIVTWYDRRSGANNDVYAQHVLASGAVDGGWPTDGRAVCALPNEQHSPTIVSDGGGGAIITWQDSRSGTYDIYAHHVLPSGALDGSWPVDGRALCVASGDQGGQTIVSDGAGGAIVTWYDVRTGDYDIYAQHLLSTGAVDGIWPPNGAALCTAGGPQIYPALVGDGLGGAIVTWQDFRNGGSYDIYAYHVLASGVADPAWPSTGLAVCTAGNFQQNSRIVSDGAGGAIVTWQDLRNGSWDVYAQRLMASGAVDGAWPVNGRALCTAGGDQYCSGILSDGAGGAIVPWHDSRSGNNDIYAQHVLASGVVDGAWPTDGRAVCVAAGDQGNPSIVSDGASGMIVTWHDNRGGNYDIYTQRVAPSGHLGNPEITLISVRDVPNDNGGKVKLSWTSNYLDTEVPYVVDHYWIFRSAPPQLASQALARGARLIGRDVATPEAGEPIYLTTVASATTYYWEFVASQAATHFASGYSYTASTANDSMAAGNPRTAFIVVAYNAANTFYIATNADSGYSVDNLPPVIPGPFEASYAGGATHLRWAPGTEADLDHYQLYRGVSDDFVPGPANRIATISNAEYVDAGPPGSAYKLSALDVHGNESDYAELAASGTVGSLDGGPPLELSFGRPAPNPAISSATVHLALPREAHVSLAIHDIAGRQVRSLIRGVVGAGERDVAWDLRDASGARVADGIYFMRLETQASRLTRTIAVVH